MVESTNGQKRTPNTVGLDLLAEYARKNELAREFGVSPRTIERWVRRRLLPRPVRLGRTLLFHLPTVRRHLENLSDVAAGRRRRQR